MSSHRGGMLRMEVGYEARILGARVAHTLRLDRMMRQVRGSRLRTEQLVEDANAAMLQRVNYAEVEVAVEAMVETVAVEQSPDLPPEGSDIRSLEARNIEDLVDAGMNEAEYQYSMKRACVSSKQLTLSSSKVGQFCSINFGSEYWCRESNMNDCMSLLEGDKANTAVHLMVYSREKAADTLRTYFSRVEKVYNFKGTLTSIREESIPTNGLRRNTGTGFDLDKCNILTFRTADEWHRSPTLYQVYNLLIRLIIMSLNGPLDKRSFDLSRWDEDDKDILAPFDFKMMGDKWDNTTDYGEKMYPSLQKYAHVVLSQRHPLFSGELEYEWAPTMEDTEYGRQEHHTLFAHSGILAFGRAADRYFSWAYDIRIKSKHLAPYFKFVEKVEVIEAALQNCGMYTGAGGR